MSWDEIPEPSHTVIWLYVLLCAAPFVATGLAFTPAAECGQGCAGAYLLLMGALAIALTLFVTGIFLRKAQRDSGRPSTLALWAIASQVLSMLISGGLLLTSSGF
jgi:hypothetical protein